MAGGCGGCVGCGAVGVFSPSSIFLSSLVVLFCFDDMDTVVCMREMLC